MSTNATLTSDLAKGPGPEPAGINHTDVRARSRRWPSVRTLVLQTHRWMGLTVGLIVVYMAITGFLIAYRPHLEPIVNRDLLTVPACTERVPLDVLAVNARAAHPAGELDYIRLTPGKDGEPRMPAAMVRINEPDEYQHEIYVNPCTGAVLGWRDRYGVSAGVLSVLEQLHRFRFVEGGSLIAGTTALLFVIALIGGGLYMWWPRRTRAFKTAATLNSRLNGRERTMNRHKVIGLYASLIVLATALTGLPLSFEWFRHGVYAMVGSAPEKTPKVKPAPDAQPQSMESVWKTIRSLVPNPGETLIKFPNPRKPNNALDHYTVAKDAPHAFARTMVYIDPHTGKVVRFTPYEMNSAGHKLYFSMLSWHLGLIGPKWLNLALPILLMFGAGSVPFLAYTGASSFIRRKFRKSPGGARLSVQIAAKRNEATDICTFELADPLGNALPKFSAGSHIDVYVGDGIVRQYSLCNDPRETHRYLIGVLRTPDSRGGSAAMHDNVQEGDELEISEPKNHFPLAHGAKRSLLIAGGIGITPLLCMAERLANTGGPFELHYCTRSRERTAFVERIRASSFADRVHFHFNDGSGAEQKLDVEELLSAVSSDTHLYVCGPKGFMDMVLGAARKQRWPDQRLHREYFSSEVRSFADDKAFDVRLASTGNTYRIDRGQTVVAALARHGIDIPTSCAQGVCGTCVTRVIDGDPDHRDMYLTQEEQKRNDQFTPCCSRAKSPVLVLDL